MTPKEKALKIATEDRFAVTSGVEFLDAGDEYAVCTMKITKDHLNAAGVVQGGAIFTLADTAFAMACNSLEENITVAINNNISFLKSAKGDTLIATARKISSSKRVCTYEIEVKDNLGELIACMTGTGYVTGRRFAE